MTAANRTGARIGGFERRRLGSPGRRPWGRPESTVVVAVVFLVLALGTLILGLSSLVAVRDDFDPPLGFLSIVSAIIGLYTNDTPDWESQGVAMPLGYEIAKVLGPLSTGYAFASAAAVLLGAQLRMLRARLARNHSIVCGGESSGVALARELAASGVAVLVDADAGGLAASASMVRRVIALSGDPRDGLVLRRAGLRRAREVFALAGDDDVNASITLAALASGVRRREPLLCYALVDDLALHLTLQAHFLNADPQEMFGLHLLDRHQLYASAVVGREPPGDVTIVVGSGESARAIALEITRRLIEHPRRDGGARLFLVGKDSMSIREVIRSRWSGSADRLNVIARESVDEPSALVTATEGEPAMRVFVSEADGDRATLRTGLSWLHQLPRVQRVVLCMAGESGLTSSFSQHADELFARAGGVLGVYSPVIALSDPAHIRDQTFPERMARRLHTIYLADVAADASSDQGASAARRPWSDLPETLKNSNRDQATELGRKVAALGMSVAPVGAAPARLVLSEAQVEKLAEMEHERWMSERLRSGVTLGPERTATEHPDLIPWRELSEPAREKDRVFMRRIPDLLLAEGLEIVADPIASSPDSLETG